MPEVEEEEPRRSDPLPKSIFSSKSIDFQAKHICSHEARDLSLEA